MFNANMIESTTTTSNFQLSTSMKTDMNIVHNTDNNFTMHRCKGYDETTRSITFKNGPQVIRKLVSVSSSSTSTDKNTIDCHTKKRNKLYKTETYYDGHGRNIQNDTCNHIVMNDNSGTQNKNFYVANHPPRFCHTFKAATASSRRTREAAIAYKTEAKKFVKKSTKHRRQMNCKRKSLKQQLFLKSVKPRSKGANGNVKLLTIQQIKERIVICDGGNTESDILSPIDRDIFCLKIRDGDLWVSDTKNSSLGLRYVPKNYSFPTFIRLPRKESLQISTNGQEVCNAMRLCALSQKRSLTRGIQRKVYSDSANKYCCIGAQPGRNVKGVLSGLYKIKKEFTCKEWDILQNTLKRAEHAFDKYVNTDVIRHISCAKSLINFATMVASTPLSVQDKPTRYYSGLGFGLNVHLRAHTDNDFTMSIVQAHIDKQHYKENDAIICYFAFPRIGIAVALRPGDFLLFNPQEPHCISSRCVHSDEVYSMSAYLKTAIVGLNDNSNNTV